MASCRVCGNEADSTDPDLCMRHWRRKSVYGAAETIDPPIPHHEAPGVPDERVAELKAMSWRELVAYCDWLRS